MVLKLYMIAGSPPVRAVLMCARALNLPLELKRVDLSKKEQLKPEFLKMNPQHTVPTLDDDGFFLWDSHAIMPYLIAKFAKNDDLYPKDLQKRAVIDQRLHFDSSVLFPRISPILGSVVFEMKKEINKDHVVHLNEAYAFLEFFLERNDWLAGDKPTIADISVGASFSSVEFLVPPEENKFPRLKGWFKNLQNQPFYEANLEGLNDLKNYVYQLLGNK